MKVRTRMSVRISLYAFIRESGNGFIETLDRNIAPFADEQIAVAWLEKNGFKKESERSNKLWVNSSELSLYLDCENRAVNRNKDEPFVALIEQNTDVDPSKIRFF